MRLPHHLRLASNGRFYFRLNVPADLRQQLGKTEIVLSLNTRDPVAAKTWAYGLSSRYLAEFHRGRASMRKNSLDEAIRAAAEGKQYEITLANGTRIKAEGVEDHQRALEAIEKIGVFSSPVTVQTTTGPAGQPLNPIKLSEGIKKYTHGLTGKSKVKTAKAKKRAVEVFQKWKGDVLVSSITRTDLADYCAFLINRQLSPPTINNQFIWLKLFFDDMTAKGCYPKGDNPAQDQYSYTKADQKKRKKFGAEPFSHDEVRLIFSPKTYSSFKLAHQYWPPLISLMTGARVNEICQMLLDDIIKVEGVQCLKITDEGIDQSVKTDNSLRIVPIHPNLIQLGLLDYVKETRKLGLNGQLFPALRNGDNGFGDAASKTFNRYVKKLKIKAKTGTKSFHSFRHTAIQRCQERQFGVPAEFRCQYVGHELEGDHFVTYSRKYSPEELAAVVHPALAFDLDLDALKVPADKFNGVIVRTMKERARKEERQVKKQPVASK